MHPDLIIRKQKSNPCAGFSKPTMDAGCQCFGRAVEVNPLISINRCRAKLNVAPGVGWIYDQRIKHVQGVNRTLLAIYAQEGESLDYQ
jgi:hypothetical protein